MKEMPKEEKEMLDRVFVSLVNHFAGKLVSDEVGDMLSKLDNSKKKRAVGWNENGVYYHSSRNTKNSIALSKEGGVNPALLKCVCGKDFNGIILPGKLYQNGKEVKAPMFMRTIQLCVDCVCKNILAKLLSEGASYTEGKGLCFGKDDSGSSFLGPEKWVGYSYEHLKEK